MRLPQLSAIKAGEAKLSSEHLQAPLVTASFLRHQTPSSINARSEHRLVQVEPGLRLEVVNTEVTRETPDTVSLLRATSTTDVVEGPTELSAEQMTPRASALLLPPLAELGQDDYLQGVGGPVECLSDEHSPRAIEPAHNRYGVRSFAPTPNDDTYQVTRDNIEAKVMVRDHSPIKTAALGINNHAAALKYDVQHPPLLPAQGHSSEMGAAQERRYEGRDRGANWER